MWAVLAPEALAYASIARVSPVVGLYASPAAVGDYATGGAGFATLTVADAVVAAEYHPRRVMEARPHSHENRNDDGAARRPGRGRAPARGG